MKDWLKNFSRIGRLYRLIHACLPRGEGYDGWERLLSTPFAEEFMVEWDMSTLLQGVAEATWIGQLVNAVMDISVEDPDFMGLSNEVDEGGVLFFEDGHAEYYYRDGNIYALMEEGAKKWQVFLPQEYLTLMQEYYA